MNRIVTAIALALASCASEPVSAQGTNCPSFSDIQEVLTGRAGEQVIIASVSNNGTAFMFWLNPKTESWTITETVGECTYLRSYGAGVVIVPMGERA